MKSLTELYKIGKGPSSSHTMGPQKAAKIYAKRHPDAHLFDVTLYGSLAATGKGHMTDTAIIEVLSPIATVNIHWEPNIFLPYHPNGMKFTADGADEWIVYSVGGGALSEGKAEDMFDTPEVYEKNSLSEILAWCDQNGRSYWEYVDLCEGDVVWPYLQEVWETMQECVERGINHEGVLPGPLNLPRKAPTYYVKATGYKQSLQTRGLVYAYALAASEENASGGTIVTAPHLWCLRRSASRTIPSFQRPQVQRHPHPARPCHGWNHRQRGQAERLHLGADVGCQGEVGVACAMASAAACQLFGGSPAQIEYAAEMGLEHHLGMTCDPVCGLVQIPCIERNAFAATRSLDANLYSAFSDGKHRVSFDRVVQVMKQTGHDLPSLYKETSTGGLAKTFKNIK